MAPAPVYREDSFERRLVGRQAGLIRPSGSTAVTSTITTPALTMTATPNVSGANRSPEHRPRCTDIGDNAMRLARVTPDDDR